MLSLPLLLAAAFTATNSYEVTVRDWTTNNWVFAPTVLYGGNRYRSIPEDYAPVIRQAPLDMPITMTDVYRLSCDGSPSKVEFLAGDASAPMFGWWEPAAKKGVLIQAEPFTAVGETGFAIEEDPAARTCVFRVSAPCVRTRRYRMCGFDPSDDKPADPSARTPLRIVRLEFPAASVTAYLDAVLTHRKDLTGPTAPPQIEPFGYLLDRLFEAVDTRAWYEKGGYVVGYPPNLDPPISHIQVGWCGVPIYLVPLMLAPTEERIRRCSLTLDALAKMPGRTGFFHAVWKDGVLYGESPRKDPRVTRAMIRRQTAGLMSGLDTVSRIRACGHPVKPAWERTFRGVADALVRHWRRYGDLGQFVDVDTGEMIVPNSTNGALAPAALLVAAAYFGDEGYVRSALEIAEKYRVEHLARGYSGGGPVEALQCPDSESAGELVVSFERLWEKTGDAKWLRAACDAAALVATWVNAWDYPLPKSSRLGMYGTRTCGAVWANVQNRHGAPGHFHYGGGDALFRLWRATGDERLWELMADTARFVGQVVHTDLHPVIPEGRAGGVSERVNTGDWEGRAEIGGNLVKDDCNMCWVTTAIFQMLEVPGVYVLHDGERTEVRAIDRVKASWRDGRLVLENPTACDTTVTVLEETAAERAKPLGSLPSCRWKRVHLARGGGGERE